jgi:tetrahydromethanopterin S-methyltransferase subunit C
VHRIGAPVALPLARACPIAREFLVAGGFAAVSLLLFGRDVLGRLDSACLCDGSTDPSIAMCSLTWWPFALAHGAKPALEPHCLGS